MAKGKRDEQRTNGIGKGHIKFRYVDGDKYLDLDMEGVANEAVAEGLKSIANALAGKGAAGPARTLPRSTAAPAAPVLDSEEEPVSPDEVETEEDTVEEPVSEETSGEGQEPRPRRRSAPKAPTFLSDLDLTKSSVQLADFVQQKNPGGDMERFAVIAFWFKEHMNLDEVTTDHIFTAYKTLGWQSQMPDDPGQTFRNLKSNKNWFDSGSKRGAYKINWNGINSVNKMGATNP